MCGIMYKNKTKNNRNNVCGEKIQLLRKTLFQKTSQRQFAEMLNLAGLDVDKNAVRRIESGERFVTDIELRYIAKVLRVTYTDLLDDDDEAKEDE